MRVHVEGEVVDLMEGLVADDALVGLFDAVRQFVVLVVALLVEALAAVLAHKRLESGVDPDVRVEGGGSVKSLAARGAFVRLFRRVDDLVPAQGGRLAESFPAHFAHKRTGARVDGHVPRQVVVGVEDFAAVRTGEDAAFAAVVVVVILSVLSVLTFVLLSPPLLHLGRLVFVANAALVGSSAAAAHLVLVFLIVARRVLLVVVHDDLFVLVIVVQLIIPAANHGRPGEGRLAAAAAVLGLMDAGTDAAAG